MEDAWPAAILQALLSPLHSSLSPLLALLLLFALLQ
jgi:hypothetical protein